MREIYFISIILGVLLGLIFGISAIFPPCCCFDVFIPGILMTEMALWKVKDILLKDLLIASGLCGAISGLLAASIMLLLSLGVSYLKGESLFDSDYASHGDAYAVGYVIGFAGMMLLVIAFGTLISTGISALTSWGYFYVRKRLAT